MLILFKSVDIYGISGYILLYMGMYGYIWVCMGMYGYIWVYMGMYGYIFVYIWVCMVSSKSGLDIR